MNVRARWPYLILIGGVALLGLAIWQLISPDLSCRGQPMTGDAVCVEGNGSDAKVLNVEQRRREVMRDSVFGIVITVPLIGISARALIRRRMRRRGGYQRRRRLAQAMGWTYLEKSEAVLAGWGLPEGGGHGTRAVGVISGSLDGLAVEIFDVADTDGDADAGSGTDTDAGSDADADRQAGAGARQTAWVVTVPSTSGDGLVRWAASGRVLNRWPLTRVTVGERKIANVTTGPVQELSDKELLRPARRLVRLAQQYLAQSSSVTPMR